MYVTVSEENYTFLKHVIGFENLDGYINTILEQKEQEHGSNNK